MAEHVLNQIGFRWINEPTRQGAIVHAVVDGRAYAVFVPIGRITLEFSRELGQPPASVGAYPTVAGLFGWVKKAARSVSRAVKKTVKKAGRIASNTARSVSRAAKRVVRKVVPKSIRRAVTRVYNAAAKFVKGIGNIALSVLKNPYVRAAMAAISTAVPILAPAAVALETANRLWLNVEKGVKAAQQIQRGVKTVTNLAAVRAGNNAKAVVASMAKKARQGDQRAQQVMGGVQRLLAA